MSKTKIAVWFACGLLAMLAASAARADDRETVEKKITRVEFNGAEHFSADELQRYTSLGPGMEFDAGRAADDCAAIVRHYQEHGYPFVTCTYNHDIGFMICLGWNNWSGGKELIYTINEGPKVKVHRVEFVGNTFVGADVLAEHIESHKRGSSRTNFALVHDDVIRLTEYYRLFGYLDVVVSYELQWNLDGGEATMMFRIHEGERYKVKK